MIRVALLLIAFLWYTQGNSQELLQPLSPAQFIQQVVAGHPLSKQADLVIDQAQGTILSARGGFDPKLFSDWERKFFDQKNYFTQTKSGLKAPSQFGLEFEFTYQTAEGIFLNPALTVPDQGQFAFTINASLLQGLITDERRIRLQQSLIGRDVATAQRVGLLNTLIESALVSYWEWIQASNEVLIVNRALANAQQRFDNTKEGYSFGDLPAIDTLEAFIQVQTRSIELQDARLKQQKAGWRLNFWLDQSTAQNLQAQQNFRPPNWQSINTPFGQGSGLEEWLLQLQNHPDLLVQIGEINQLDLERKLQKEMLKPELNVSYSFLSDGTDFTPTDIEAQNGLNELFTQDYKWGIQFSMPILYRKERGKLQELAAKQEMAKQKQINKQQDLQTKLLQQLNELRTLDNQIVVMRDMVNNYQRMLDAELEKFNVGESSMFLVNSREQKLVEAQVKQLKMQTQYWKTVTKLNGVAGLLPERFGINTN